MTSSKLKLLHPTGEGDGAIIERLSEIASLDEVHAVVGLVDVHMKRSTECPSSVATATKDVLLPKLSSVAQNCGMSLALTGYQRSNIPNEYVDSFMASVAESDAELMRRPAMGLDDMEEIVKRGAEAIVEKFDLPREMLENVEQGGRVGDAGTWNDRELRKLVPSSTLNRGRFGFGVIPSGNHFLELQVVEEIINDEECEKWGLRSGDVTLMIHSDGGVVSDDLGNLYGNRTTMSGALKLLFGVRKARLHLTDPTRINSFRQRWSYYFGSETYGAVDPESEEGRRFLDAHRMSMNAGYASRLESLRRFQQIMSRDWGSPSTDFKILRDISHNSIFKETWEDGEFWVHRHNANRVAPGELVFVPGYDYTSSYVCVGDEGAPSSLYSVDHGAGETIKRYKSQGRLSVLEDGAATRRYDNIKVGPTIVPHYSDEGLGEVIDHLQRHRVVKPIARLRPFAGYRYKWKGRFDRTRDAVKAMTARVIGQQGSVA